MSLIHRRHVGTVPESGESEDMPESYAEMQKRVEGERRAPAKPPTRPARPAASKE